MPNIPVSDPLKRQANGGTPARSQPSTKRIEGDTDADKLKGQPISTVAPTDGQALTWRGTEYVPETPAVTPASTPSGVTEHAIMGTEHTGDFELTLNGGLSVTVQPGRFHVNQTIYDKIATNLTLAANASNYIYCFVTGSVTSNSSSGFPAGAIPLYTVTTLGSSVNQVTDRRTPFRAFLELEAAADAHIADTSDAHDASAISLLDAAGDFTATNVEDALAEIQSDNEAHVAAADPHTGYVREADANWIDLTDGGASALHSHAGGGAAHAMLDGGTAHTDTDTNTVSVGSFIYGNATPKWDEFPIVIPAAGLRNVVTVDNGDVVPSYKTVLDTSSPANIAAAAAPGTSLVFARRDHVHALLATLYFSERIHTFAPDAAPGADIVSGNQQDFSLSSPNGETAVELTGMAETAAGTAFTVNVEYGDTWDLDAVAAWVIVASLTMSTQKGVTTTSMSNATIPANRILRFNVTTITGTAPRDSKFFLRTRVPLVT